jgi:Protein of unknown function (DUF2939)
MPRKTIWAGAILLALLFAYTAWPYKGLYDLSRAVQARDADAIAQNIHLPRLRQSLARQVLLAYAKQAGMTVRLGPFADIATGAALNLAEPLIVQIINPQNLLDLLGKGWPSQATSEVAPSAWGGMGSVGLRQAWRIYVNSEYSGRNYYVLLPVDAEPHKQFRLHLRLIRGRWKLAAMELPEELRLALGRELMRKQN